jgi:heme-degrading monooxygenase HmoA
MAFARIGIFEVPREKMSAIVGLFRDQVTPAFAKIDGFLGYQAFTEDEAGRYVGVSYWTSLDALHASAATARDARDDAARLGASIVGEPFLVREAFDTRKPT